MSKKPEKPKITASHTELLISWSIPSNIQDVDFFDIQWKKREEKRWTGLEGTEGDSTSKTIPITKFETNATYQFKVKWTTKAGEESPFSDISDGVLIQSPRQPGKIESSQTKATSARLSWVKPKYADNISHYNIEYRSPGEDKWSSVNTDQPIDWVDLEGLKSKHTYECKVRAFFSDGSIGPFSDVSDTFTTPESLATRLKTNGTKLGSEKPQRFKIPLIFSDQTTNKEAMTRKGRFGERNPLVATKTIMLVGGTGAGKSTLIDGMINYIVDVDFEDDFRFSLIDLTEDEKKKEHQQALSQTNWITCYEVNYQHGSRLNYNLNIIDTPGFGDTRGKEQDKKIVEQIRKFFTASGDQGIDTLDAVCFIVQSSLPRLTDSQTYIFHSVLSLFGKDIKDNIFVLITFADSNDPPVLAALKEANVPFQSHFRFNNVNTNCQKALAQIFWKTGITSFAAFFAKLNNVEQKSLTLTSNVLKERKNLAKCLERLPMQIEAGLQDLHTMKDHAMLVKQCMNNIEDNKDHKTYFKVKRNRTVPTTNSVTNCHTCQLTCDANCSIPFTFAKILCEVMSGGRCIVCPKKCSWSNHTNDGFIYESFYCEEETTLDDVKAKYDIAISGAKQYTDLLDKIKSDFKSKMHEVLSIMKTTRECIIKLNEGALKPEQLSEIDQVVDMLVREKNEKKFGWQDRVNILEQIISKAKSEQNRSYATALNSWTDEDIDKCLETV